MRPSRSLRTFTALLLATMSPVVTCPSPPSATLPSRRTARMVVAWNVGMLIYLPKSVDYESVFSAGSRHPSPGSPRLATLSGQQERVGRGSVSARDAVSHPPKRFTPALGP